MINERDLYTYWWVIKHRLDRNKWKINCGFLLVWSSSTNYKFCFVSMNKQQWQVIPSSQFLVESWPIVICESVIPENAAVSPDYQKLHRSLVMDYNVMCTLSVIKRYCGISSILISIADLQDSRKSSPDFWFYYYNHFKSALASSNRPGFYGM